MLIHKTVNIIPVNTYCLCINLQQKQQQQQQRPSKKTNKNYERQKNVKN